MLGMWNSSSWCRSTARPINPSLLRGRFLETCLSTWHSLIVDLLYADRAKDVWTACPLYHTHSMNASISIGRSTVLIMNLILSMSREDMSQVCVTLSILRIMCHESSVFLSDAVTEISCPSEASFRISILNHVSRGYLMSSRSPPHSPTYENWHRFMSPRRSVQPSRKSSLRLSVHQQKQIHVRMMQLPLRDTAQEHTAHREILCVRASLSRQATRSPSNAYFTTHITRSQFGIRSLSQHHTVFATTIPHLFAGHHLL